MSWPHRVLTFLILTTGANVSAGTYKDRVVRPPITVASGSENYVCILNHEGRGLMVARELLEEQPERPALLTGPKATGVIG